MTEEPIPPMPALPLESDIATVLAALFGAPLEDDEVLGRRLQMHIESLRAAAHRDDYLDIGLGERILQGLGELMSAVAGSDPADRRLVQAAARYFIHENDAIADTGSPMGLDDDAMVVGAVARHLGLDDRLPKGL